MTRSVTPCCALALLNTSKRANQRSRGSFECGTRNRDQTVRRNTQFWERKRTFTLRNVQKKKSVSYTRIKLPFSRWSIKHKATLSLYGMPFQDNAEIDPTEFQTETTDLQCGTDMVNIRLDTLSSFISLYPGCLLIRLQCSETVRMTCISEAYLVVWHYYSETHLVKMKFRKRFDDGR
jgi:hypothetical protein